MEMRLCKQASKPCRSLAEQPQPWPSPGLLHIPAPALSAPDTPPGRQGLHCCAFQSRRNRNVRASFASWTWISKFPIWFFFLLLLFYFESLAVRGITKGGVSRWETLNCWGRCLAPALSRWSVNKIILSLFDPLRVKFSWMPNFFG